MTARKDFIANIDTAVPVSRTVDQIRTLVERFRAREFRVIYGSNGVPCAARFTIVDPHLGGQEGHDGVFTVELAAPTDTLFRRINGRRTSPWTYRDRDEAQAERVAWRQLHDIIRASLMGVEAGLFTIGEAFLCNLIVSGADGSEARLGQLLMERRLLAPDSGLLRLGAGQ